MKIIVVNGPKGSGKTSSIKAAAKLLGVELVNPIADILMIARLKLGRSIYTVGLAGAGDSIEIIRNNIEFFGCHELDCMVLACSAPRSGLPVIKALATLHSAPLIVINTEKVSMARVTAHVADVSQEIFRSIP